MSKLTSNQNSVCFGILTLNILEHISWVNSILQKWKLYAKWKASKMPTKAFITHFREKIFYIGVQNVHIPKIYFARVFHQAYIYLLFLRKGMPCQLFLLYKSLTTITSNEWLCGGGVTKIASFNVYMYTNYSLFINKSPLLHLMLQR